MGLLQRIFGTGQLSSRDDNVETRFDPFFDPRFLEANYLRARTLVPSSDIVLSNLAVAARCIALRSEMLASVPLFLYRRDADGGRERADDNPLYGVLHDISNPNQSAFEFREFMVRCLDLYGNFYARIERNARGQVTALYPFLYGDVQVEQLPNGRLRYRIYNGRSSEVLLQEDMLHVRGASRDGIIGQSPITIARGALSLALAHQETAQSFSENSLRPSGIISYPNLFTPEQRQAVKDTAKDSYGGVVNAGKLMVIDAGAKYEPMSFSPEDAQFLESRKLSNEDVARVFGLPPLA